MVPILVVDGRNVVYESLAILQFLEENFTGQEGRVKGACLMPKSPHERAMVYVPETVVRRKHSICAFRLSSAVISLI